MFGHPHSNKDAGQAADDAGQDVDGPSQPLAVLQQARRFPAERRERGERAEKAGGNTDAPFRGNRQMGQCVFRDASEEKTSHQVHDQRAPGESRAGALLDESLKPIARQSSQCSEYNE